MNLKNIKIIADNIKTIFWRYLAKSEDLKTAQMELLKNAQQKSDEERLNEIRYNIKNI